MPARTEVSRQVTESGRARGIAAAIEGYFAVAWFGWAMASAVPRLLTLVLQIGIGLGILVAIAGIVLAVRSPAQSTPMRDRAVRRRYGIVVGLEFALGRRLVPQLVVRGHQVTATTTSAAKLGLLDQLGAEAVVMDGLDAASVGEAVAAAGHGELAGRLG